MSRGRGFVVRDVVCCWRRGFSFRVCFCMFVVYFGYICLFVRFRFLIVVLFGIVAFRFSR